MFPDVEILCWTVMNYVRRIAINFVYVTSPDTCYQFL